MQRISSIEKTFGYTSLKEFQTNGVSMSTLILFSLFITAEAKKSKDIEKAVSTDIVAEVKKETKAANVPADKVSAKFAAKLLSTTAKNISPNAEGLIYRELTFSADNTFTTMAVVAVMDEEMECTESGTWTMDAAKEANIANMNWDITSTDCPTRQAPINLRVEVELVPSESGMFTKFR